jgi:ankyrin repeat protein
VKDNLGYTPFLITERPEVVKFFLENDYASIHETNNAGQTALMFAATNGGTATHDVKRLVAHTCAQP